MSVPANDTTSGTLGLLLTLLPGPSRKRIEAVYSYRLIFRQREDGGAGCVLMWEVSGGRLAYQIALERDPSGNLHLHCTCADAIFRAEAEGRFCKHVRGLLDFTRREMEPSQAAVRLGA